MPSYELAQMQLSRFGQDKLLGIRHVVAGSFAGLCGSLVKVPVDVVKKRLQAGMYPHVGAAVTSIASEGIGFAGGFRQFYTGWRSSIIYDVPYSAIQFTVLENVKQCVRRLKRSELAGVDHVIVGALTGMITSVITEPLDVIKTRLMTQRVKGVRPGLTMYRGWLHCMKTIVHEEGPLALWKGTLPRLVWVGASSAIWYGTYQAVRQNMNQKRQMARNDEEGGSISRGVK
ncbi:Mitochondrial carrier [Gracilaria domingensis]|nr:Mitochondrial carrier [Gracilaria domingensis]